MQRAQMYRGDVLLCVASGECRPASLLHTQSRFCICLRGVFPCLPGPDCCHWAA